MALSRRQIREHIFRLIFDYDFCPATEQGEQTQLYFEQVPDEEIPNPPMFAGDDKEYIADKAQGIVEHLASIDTTLNEAAKGWTTGRMAKTDLSILRLAVYEMLYDDAIPVGVAINEAVELAKVYCTEESPAFINGVLAKVAQGMEEARNE